jgi:hypothetical protein
LIAGIRSLTLAWMTLHTLAFVHVLLAMALAVVLFRVFFRRPLA